MRLVVLGASGMIGHAMFRTLRTFRDWTVWGTVRSKSAFSAFADDERKGLLLTGDLVLQENAVRIFADVRPDVVINCVGLTKHHRISEDPLLALPINSMLPHRLADLCQVGKARFIHISTDCVFDGSKGNYRETDFTDATDLYGRSKAIGEIVSSPHAVTLRTSTIGHELQSAFGLLEWFLSQQGSCKGYRKAVFSGLPTPVLAEVIRDYVLPNPDLKGLYHVGGPPIDKCELLQLIKFAYNKEIAVVPDDKFVIDRSLNCERFTEFTGFRPASWSEMVNRLHAAS